MKTKKNLFTHSSVETGGVNPICPSFLRGVKAIFVCQIRVAFPPIIHAKRRKSPKRMENWQFL